MRQKRVQTVRSPLPHAVGCRNVPVAQYPVYGVDLRVASLPRNSIFHISDYIVTGSASRMARTPWIALPIALSLLLLRSSRSAGLGDTLFNNSDQLFEGNPCPLEDGAGDGLCKKLDECPERREQIRTGDYDPAGRCGFDNFDEIVCCATRRRRTLRNRADDACQRYKRISETVEDPNSFHTTVVNGVRARAKEFPHMAALGYVEGGSAARYNVCGGTLISRKHVLTAAHCVDNVHNLVPVEVLLGTTDVGLPEAGVQRVPISRIIKHPEYRTSLSYHDVAILELRTRVEFTPHVQPTCLLTKPVPEAGEQLVVLGWGAVDLGGEASTNLLKAERMQTVGKTECSKSYENVRTNIPGGLDDGMICVRDPNVTRSADTCWGDSGGPLLVQIPKFAPLVGVTSFGRGCGSRVPGVYASVFKHLAWIEDQVWPISV